MQIIYIQRIFQMRMHANDLDVHKSLDGTSYDQFEWGTDKQRP